MPSWRGCCRAQHGARREPGPANRPCPTTPRTYQPPDVHHHDEELVVLVGDGELHLAAHLPQGTSPRGVWRGEGTREGRGGDTGRTRGGCGVHPSPPTCWFWCRAGASCLLIPRQWVEKGVDEVALRGKEGPVPVTTLPSTQGAHTDALRTAFAPFPPKFLSPAPPVPPPGVPRPLTSATSGAAWMRCQM